MCAVLLRAADDRAECAAVGERFAGCVGTRSSPRMRCKYRFPPDAAESPGQVCCAGTVAESFPVRFRRQGRQNVLLRGAEEEGARPGRLSAEAVRCSAWLPAKRSVREAADDLPPAEGKRDLLQKAKKQAAEQRACARAVANC